MRLSRQFSGLESLLESAEPVPKFRGGRRNIIVSHHPDRRLLANFDIFSFQTVKAGSDDPVEHNLWTISRVFSSSFGK
jgi:hypothetical protein